MTKPDFSILVTDSVHQDLLDGLAVLGQVDYRPQLSYDAVCECINAYQGLIINSKILVNDRFLELGHQLKWIGRLGAGLDIVDLLAASKRGVAIINSPEGNANAVGEHTLGLLLALLNNSIFSDAMVRKLQPWDREAVRGSELDGKTIGIVGCGHTGSAFIKKLRGFEVDVLIYDKYKEHIPVLHRSQREVGLAALLKSSDIVSLHLPLTHETKQLVDRQFFLQMKLNSILINTSRGQIVNLADALMALEKGCCKGLGLDVFENEKPETYTARELETMRKLVQRQDVILSPHVAGWTIESKEKIAHYLLEKIKYVHERKK